MFCVLVRWVRWTNRSLFDLYFLELSGVSGRAGCVEMRGDSLFLSSSADLKPENILIADPTDDTKVRNCVPAL